MALNPFTYRMLRPAECQQYAVDAYASDRLGQVFALAASETRELDGLIEQLGDPADRIRYRRQWSKHGGFKILAARRAPPSARN